MPAPARPPADGSGFVFWICLFVGCTAIPMTIDLLRVFLPRRFLSGRLVERWQRPLLLAMVASLCVWAYMAFFPVAAYSHAPFSLAWFGSLSLITFLWVNTVWNYGACASVDPGYASASTRATSGEDGRAGSGDWATWPSHKLSHEQSGAASAGDMRPVGYGAPSEGPPLCRICGRRVHSFDHHCPFTGGCVGRDNYRFFALFLLHCTLGCGVACALAWPPFLECVLQQCTMPSIGLQRKPPPDEAQCVALGTRSLLLLPAACLFLALSLLGAFHAALLRAGLTTVQFSKRWRAHGAAASLRALVRAAPLASPPPPRSWAGTPAAPSAAPSAVRSAPDDPRLHQIAPEYTDKWELLWGMPSAEASAWRKLRVLLLPSMPLRRRWSPGVGAGTSWLGAAAVLTLLFLLLQPAAAAVGGLARTLMAQRNEG